MNQSNKILAYIKITRPINVLITFFVVVVAILISQKNQTEISLIIWASVAAALTAAAGNIINDIFDVEADKISHPQRVLVSGVLTKKGSWFEYIILNSISGIIAIYLSTILFIIVLTTISILFVYALYFKKILLTGNIIIAILTGLAFIYGGFAAGNPQASIIPAIFAFLINFIREIVKDIQDIEGDKKQNIQTFPIQFGLDAATKLIVSLSIILIAFTFYPFIMHLYKIEYFILVMIVVNPIMVLSIKYLWTNKENKFYTVSKLLKFNMIIGLISIYLGR